MRRREFLLGASGATAAGAVVASTPGAAQETPTGTPGDGGTETPADDEGGGGGGETVEVALVDFAFEPGTDEPLVIPPGTTVNFVWETSTHNIVIDSKPDESDWEGHEPIENQGFEHSHTFEVTGTYEFHCQPHQAQGMVGEISVEEGASVGGGGGEATGEVDPEEMGVPIQAHWVGTATILMIIVSLVFTFYLLKYGETPHSGYPKR